MLLLFLSWAAGAADILGYAAVPANAWTRTDNAAKDASAFVEALLVSIQLQKIH